MIKLYYFAGSGINNTLITLVVITSNSWLECFSFFSCNLSNDIFLNILLEMIVAVPLETIIDENKEGDSDIGIN